MMKKFESKKILIAGAGIAGLYAADLLTGQGYDVTVVEALDRVGGKLLSGTIASFSFDLGGQGFSREMKRVERLGKRLGINRVEAPEAGGFFLEGATLHTGSNYRSVREERLAFDEQAALLQLCLIDSKRRAELQAKSVMDLARDYFTPIGLEYFRTNFSSEWCALPECVSLLHFLEVEQGFEGDEAEEMAFRYREGFSAMAERLACPLSHRVCLNAALESVRVHEGGVTAKAGAATFEASALVLAIPLLRIPLIHFSGFDVVPLIDSLSAYRGCSVRKVIAVYDRPFWGDKARSGEFAPPCGMSMLDNSDFEKQVYSLAIFLGGPAAQENPGREAILARVAEVLGPEALSPIGYHEHAWLNASSLSGGYASNRAPTGGGSAILPTQLAGRIFLAGSETADHFPTYVEGALASAERAVAEVVRSLNMESVLT
jgi:monoamine oxidase